MNTQSIIPGVTHIEIFENIIAARCYIETNETKSNQNTSNYAMIIIDYIINNNSEEEKLIFTLSKYINNILYKCKPVYNMTNDDICNSISELSIYATIFVDNNKYSEIYDKICKILIDIRHMYPCPPMDWISLPKAKPDEYD